MRTRDRNTLISDADGQAQVRIIDEIEASTPADGSAHSRQVAEVRLPRAEIDRIWTPEYLERLARTYWRYLTRVSLGLLRVLYTADAREVVFLGRPLVLLRFRAPQYDLEPDRGSVTWRIDRGVLVARAGRDRGYLRITVEQPAQEDPGAGEGTLRVSSEVTSFYPTLAAARPGGRAGWAGRLAVWFYSQTQLRIHVLVTNGFLRSLARRELETSSVGALQAERAN